MATTPRQKIAAGPFRGGLDQFSDAIFVDPGDFTEAFNVFGRPLAVEKRTGFSRQFALVSSVATVPFAHQFIARNGSRFLFAMASGTFYKLS